MGWYMDPGPCFVYVPKIFAYPQFSLWIPIVLAKIYFFRMVLIWGKNLTCNI